MTDNVAKYGLGIDLSGIKAAITQVKKLKEEMQALQKLKPPKAPKMPKSPLNPSSPKSPKTGDPNTKDFMLVERAIKARQAREAKRQNDLWMVEGKNIKERDKAAKQSIDRKTRADNAAKRASEQRVSSLNKARESVNNSALMMEKEAKGAHKVTQQRIRQRIATAKTAEHVRRIVAQERAGLKLAKKKSFLMTRMQASSQQIAGNMASAFAIGAVGFFVTKTGQDFEAVGNTMLAVSKNSEMAGENLKFVREEAFRLGLGLKDSAKSFAKMLAARGDMSVEETRKAFSGVSEMATLLGLSAEESTRSINALQQMMSKGVVSAKTLAL
jgi:hypothetical protein